MDWGIICNIHDHLDRHTRDYSKCHGKLKEPLSVLRNVLF